MLMNLKNFQIINILLILATILPFTLLIKNADCSLSSPVITVTPSSAFVGEETRIEANITVRSCWGGYDVRDMQASLTIPPEATLISGDNPTNISYVSKGSSFNVTWVLTFQTVGAFQVDVTVSGYRLDNGEFVEREGSVEVTVSTVKILSPKDTTYLVNSIPMTVSAVNASWIGYSLDEQANVTLSGNTTLTGVSDGFHHLKVFANTTFGATGSDEVSFTVDTTPPLISILTPENTTYLSSVPLEFKIDEPVSWTGYSLDGSVNVTLTGNTTLVGLSEGLHCVDVFANDSVGHFSVESVCFTVDLTAPEVSFSYSPDSPVVHEAVFFNASESRDLVSEIVSYFWDFGDGTNTTETDATTQHTYTHPDVFYNVILRVQDKAGNTAVETVKIYVEETLSDQPIPIWIPLLVILVISMATAGGIIFILRTKKNQAPKEPLSAEPA